MAINMTFILSSMVGLGVTIGVGGRLVEWATRKDVLPPPTSFDMGTWD